MTRKKRLIIATAVAPVVFGAMYGLAASLNMTTDSLGAATQTVAACQAGALNATYQNAYSATTPGYTVPTVTVTGLASTCYSKNYRVTLSGAGNASLGEATGTTPATGASFVATFGSPVNAASVTGISVVLEG